MNSQKRVDTNRLHAKSLTRLRTRNPLKTLLIRTAAGPSIGFGHLKRTLILARHIQDCARPVFLLDPGDPWAQEQATLSGFEFVPFDARKPWPSITEPAAVLIDTRKPAGLSRLIAEAHRHKVPVASIHDLGLAPVASDVAIDGSILPGHFDPDRHGAVRFSGTDYLILADDPAPFQASAKRIRSRIQKVAINLGGGDGSRYYPKILEGLQAVGSSMEVIGFPGFCSWGQDELGRADWRPLDFRWLSTGDRAAELVSHADLVISAGGLSAYEALFSGTPLCALAYDRYQELTIRALTRAGASVNLGRGSHLKSADIADRFRALDRDPEHRQRLSIRGCKLVDGHGARRIGRILRSLILGGLAGITRPVPKPSTLIGSIRVADDTRSGF